MHDHKEEVAEKLAEIYQQMVAHAGEKAVNTKDIHVEAYLHIAFSAPESNCREVRMGVL
ncbi:hypothetical protein Q4E93_26570 [Flavitalea sp. BT771]|uniref:hypothetical protein n=1 Tax=Flavitalea sp. BT771 TaxID=3063329 RepID=UPI0026E37897|nr:hypothetical protein [Flavitalea sp. BT771]MDO6434202.1 hypothetical protein [Flavitalea sp. BT771]MDV6223102.1 hypothetical protein [Flavitalea sp. BT771]